MSPLLKPLTEMQLGDMQRWLRVALVSYFVEDLGRAAFEPIAPAVGEYDDITDDLTAIYKDVPEKTRDFFRQSIAHALATVPPESHNLEVFDALLVLAQQTRASGSFDAIHDRVSKGFFGEHESLYLRAFQTAASLADTTESCRRCLDGLINNSRFRPTMAANAIIALCRAWPGRLYDHLIRVERAFHDMLDDYTRSEEARARVFTAIYKAAGDDDCLRTLNRLTIEQQYTRWPELCAFLASRYNINTAPYIEPVGQFWYEVTVREAAPPKAIRIPADELVGVGLWISDVGAEGKASFAKHGMIGEAVHPALLRQIQKARRRCFESIRG